MNKISKISIAVILSSLFLAGCSGNSATPSPTPTPTISATPTAKPSDTENTPEPTVAPDPEAYIETPMDLNGRVLTLLTINNYSPAYFRFDYDPNDKDKTPNETLEIIETLRQIEKDYNCTIKRDWLLPSGALSTFIANKAAGDTPWDILECGLTEFGVQGMYINNIVIPVTDPSISNVIKPDENPWLAASSFSRVGDTQYGVHFKTQNTSEVLRAVILFNKDHFEKFGLPDPYEMVRNKTWTWDAFSSMCAQIVMNSDKTVYPIIYNHEGLFMPMFVFANNGTLAENTDSGMKFVGHVNDNALEALSFIQSLKEKDYIHLSSDQRNPAVGAAGAKGEATFIFTDYGQLKQYTRQDVGYETEYNFGLLPAPLGPNGTEYGATVYSEFLYHIMANIEKPDEAAAVLVAIANRTRQKSEGLIEREIQYSLQDIESGEMLEIMLNNIQVDISRIHGEARRSANTLISASRGILNLTKSPAQAMQEISDRMQMWFDELNTSTNVTITN